MSEKEIKKLKDYSEEVAQQLPLLTEPAKKDVSGRPVAPSTRTDRPLLLLPVC